MSGSVHTECKQSPAMFENSGEFGSARTVLSNVGEATDGTSGMGGWNPRCVGGVQRGRVG